MNQEASDLHAEIARYEALMRGISDRRVREKLREMIAEATEKLARVAHPCRRD